MKKYSLKCIKLFYVPLVAGVLLSCAGKNYQREISSIQVINVNFYNAYGTYKISEEDKKLYTGGFEIIEESLKRDCGINLKFNLNKEQDLIHGDTKFKFKELKMKGIGKLVFYQSDLYNFLKQNKFSKNENSINVFFVDELENHCAFAIPKVQLNDIKNQKVQDLLVNSILINSAPSFGGDCQYKTRMLAHEIAHILVQDEPPHTCYYEESKTFVRCNPENIIADFEELDRPKKTSFGMNDESNFDNDFGPIKVPAKGVKFDKYQCEKIKASLI